MSRAADIEQQAARWVLRHEEPGWSAADQAALDAWLAASMAHKSAYWRLDHGWRQADRIASLGDAAGPPAVVWRGGWRGWASLAAAVAAIATVGGAAIEWAPPSPPAKVAQLYSTAVGGRRALDLTDGSKVELNTASTLRTAVTDERREVWLDRGEAYFEIAHRGGRPFVVHAGSRTITVLGTKFAVRREGDDVTVSVVEGRVRVEDALAPEAVPAAIITAGDVAVARGPSMLLAAQAEERVVSALAWRGGMVYFDRTPLSDAVAEFNRYNVRKIVIGDAETADIRIGGTFELSNVDAFVRLLHDAYGLQVESRQDGVKISA